MFFFLIQHFFLVHFHWFESVLTNALDCDFNETLNKLWKIIANMINEIKTAQLNSKAIMHARKYPPKNKTNAIYEMQKDS